MWRLLILSLVIIGVLGKPPNEKCKLTDTPCMLKVANTMYSSLFSFTSDLDPMRVDFIEGNFPTVKYTATDNNIKGLKNCQFEELSFDLDKHILNQSFICPHLEMDGKYVISGSLSDISLEGSGSYSQNASNYGLNVLVDIELPIRNGKKFINFKSFRLIVDPREKVATKIDTNKDKKRVAEMLKIFNENWKDNIRVLHGPLMTAAFQKIVKVANELFQYNSLGDYIIF